jgi:hypothetical protein
MNRKTLAFVVPLAGGLAGVVLLSLRGERLGAFVSGAAAIALHWLLSRGPGQDEESADASYFLGFLLTLALLAAGLWHLGRVPSTGRPANAVLTFLLDLAAGLGLTIIGLAVRQVRVLGVDPSLLSSDKSLQEDLRALVVSQYALTATIKELGQRLSGSVLGQTVDGANAALANAQKAASSLGSRLVSATGAMETAVDKLVDTVTKASMKLDTTTGELSESITRNVERTDARIAKTLGAMEEQIATALKAIEEQRKVVEQSLHKCTSEAEKTQQELGTEIQKQILAWKKELDMVHGTLVALHHAIETEFGHGMQAVTRATNSFTRLSQHVVEEVESLPDPSDRLVNLWTRLQGLDDLLTKSAHDASSTLIGLGDNARGAQIAVGDLTTNVDSAARQIRAGSEGTAAALRKELQEIQGVLEDFHKALRTAITAMGT